MANDHLSLAEIQQAFQAAILSGDDAILSHIRDSSRTGRDTLLGVYRHAYVARLAEILRNDHAQLALYLGDDAFDDLARLYIGRTPSSSPNARWYSGRMAEFLGVTEPYRQHGELAELAALGRALAHVFDCRDEPALTMGDIAAIPHGKWPGLVLRPRSSAWRLDFAYNTAEIWIALRDEQEPPAACALAEKQRVLVWRDGVTPRFRVVSAEEAMIWDEMAKGVTFGVLCEMAATYDDPANAPLRVAQYLQSWIASGMLAGTPPTRVGRARKGRLTPACRD
ncbi:MAG: putative DNA-binding domain-containing protein [Hyphomicrobiaceae bacterium]|nr:putative DNA-binding domain-containing protein [Hyphomicrobiaceae bacterium]